MLDDRIAGSFVLADKALAGLRACHAPAVPRFYEVLYAHAERKSPALSATLDRLGPNVTEADLDALFERHLAPQGTAKHVEAVGESISHRLGALIGIMQSASLENASYEAALADAAREFAEQRDPGTLRAAIEGLILTAVDMKTGNLELQQLLSSSLREVELLRDRLEAVRHASQRDALTGLCNRTRFDEAIASAIDDARKCKRPMCLIVADIDHFKSFNDLYGHQTGDQILRLVATTIQAQMRERDLASRYGGEEFALILPDMSIAGACGIAESIRRMVMMKELKRRSTGEVLGRVTLSLGVAALTDQDTIDTLIDRADERLYAAKASGRNCVVGIAAEGALLRLDGAA